MKASQRTKLCHCLPLSAHCSILGSSYQLMDGDRLQIFGRNELLGTVMTKGPRRVFSRTPLLLSLIQLLTSRLDLAYRPEVGEIFAALHTSQSPRKRCPSGWTRSAPRRDGRSEIDDQYRPRSLDDLNYHVDLSSRLRSLVRLTLHHLDDPLKARPPLATFPISSSMDLLAPGRR